MRKYLLKSISGKRIEAQFILLYSVENQEKFEQIPVKKQVTKKRNMVLYLHCAFSSQRIIKESWNVSDTFQGVQLGAFLKINFPENRVERKNNSEDSKLRTKSHFFWTIFIKTTVVE